MRANRKPGILSCGVIALFLMSGCATRYHYRAYLAEVDDDKTIRIASANVVNVVVEEPNKAPFKTLVTLKIKDVRVGFIHHKVKTDFRENKRYAGLGGREVWVVTRVRELRSGESITAGKEFFRVSQVRIDQESFAPLPLSKNEAIILDHQSFDSTLLVEVKIYEVDGLSYKKALLQLSETDLIKGLWDAGKGFVKGIASGTAGTILSFIEESVGESAKEDPLLVERLLIAADAEIEFSGLFYLLPQDRKNAGGPTISEGDPAEVVLFDVVRSLFDADGNGALDSRLPALLDADDEKEVAAELIKVGEAPGDLEKYARAQTFLRSLPLQIGSAGSSESTHSYVALEIGVERLKK